MNIEPDVHILPHILHSLSTPVNTFTALKRTLLPQGYVNVCVIDVFSSETIAFSWTMLYKWPQEILCNCYIYLIWYWHPLTGVDCLQASVASLCLKHDVRLCGLRQVVLCVYVWDLRPVRQPNRTLQHKPHWWIWGKHSDSSISSSNIDVDTQYQNIPIYLLLYIKQITWPCNLNIWLATTHTMKQSTDPWLLPLLIIRINQEL